MQLYLSYPLRDGPYGGGNQFLKTLYAILKKRGVMTEDIDNATIILTNSFFFQPILHAYDDLFLLKKKNPEIRFLHRMDGVFAITRGEEFHYMDELVGKWADLCTDGVIFQSHFCENMQYQHGYPQDIPATIIGNACDPNLFYPAQVKKAEDGKIRLIYTSWSPNMRKGFGTLQMLDECLDFTRYSFVFVGNSPVQFKNIRHIEAQNSRVLGELLRQSDIFIGVSHNEPCSNAIGEALACGLPVLIRNEGGNPSFVSQGAVLYNNDAEILPRLEELTAQYDTCRQRLKPLSVEDVADQYCAFAEKLLQRPPKRPSVFQFLSFRKQLSKYYPEIVRSKAWYMKFCLEHLWR